MTGYAERCCEAVLRGDTDAVRIEHVPALDAVYPAIYLIHTHGISGVWYQLHGVSADDVAEHARSKESGQ